MIPLPWGRWQGDRPHESDARSKWSLQEGAIKSEHEASHGRPICWVHGSASHISLWKSARRICRDFSWFLWCPRRWKIDAQLKWWLGWVREAEELMETCPLLFEWCSWYFISPGGGRKSAVLAVPRGTTLEHEYAECFGFDWMWQNARTNILWKQTHLLRAGCWLRPSSDSASVDISGRRSSSSAKEGAQLRHGRARCAVGGVC